jgi:transcriptional regulator with XRE-family HTH domain
VPARVRAIDRGNAIGRRLVGELSREIETARLSAGLSYAELGRAIGISGGMVGRICQGRSPDASVRRMAQLAAMVGLALSARTFPEGNPIRDRAHLELLRRFHGRLHPALRWRVEVPVVELASPGPADARSWDAAIDGLGAAVRVEAETHVRDVQALGRRVRTKQRDGRIDVVILVLSETRHHRRLLTDADPGLSELFPISTRRALAALSRGRSPGANAIVLV